MRETLRYQPEIQTRSKKVWLRQLLAEFEEERDRSSNDGREPLIKRVVGVYEALLIIDGSSNGNRQMEVNKFRRGLSIEIESNSRRAGRKVAQIIALAKGLAKSHY